MFLIVKRKVMNILNSIVNSTSVLNSSQVHGEPQEKKKTFKLPKIEIVKFCGNVRDWLQFRKIHDDPEIDEVDKFQHLMQCMESGLRAFELVNSFPPIRGNY